MLNYLNKFAYKSEDPDELRLKKLAAIIISGSCCLAGTGWTIMYYFLFGPCLTTILPGAFVSIVGTAILISHVSKNHLWAVYSQIICIIYITALIQWSIGDIFNSGFVMVWSMIGPVTALIFFSIRQASIWFFLYAINIFITIYFNDFFAENGLSVDYQTRQIFFLMNLGICGLVIFIFASYFVSNTLKERQKSDNLLLNILPVTIARRLKTGEKVIADKHENVGVLFADICGFTAYSSKAEPEDVVSRLDTIFNAFDSIASKYQLEKIKTIGDAYMVAAGVPEHSSECAANLAMMGLEMLESVKRIELNSDAHLSIRIGIHCGPVVAGVIGKSKFAYDLWGDTVNVASRMESTGEEGKIQISESFAAEISKDFDLVKRGATDIKGKGEMITYFINKKNQHKK